MKLPSKPAHITDLLTRSFGNCSIINIGQYMKSTVIFINISVKTHLGHMLDEFYMGAYQEHRVKENASVNSCLNSILETINYQLENHRSVYLVFSPLWIDQEVFKRLREIVKNKHILYKIISTIK